MKKEKEIKFKSICFYEIGIDGLIYHQYNWNKETKTLVHFINGDEIEGWSEIEAKVQIKQLIGVSSRKKENTNKTEKEVKPPTTIPDNQLKLF